MTHPWFPKATGRRITKHDICMRREENIHTMGFCLACCSVLITCFWCLDVGCFSDPFFKVESTSKLFSTHQERSASLFKMKLLYLGVKWSQQIQSTNRNVWHFLLLPFINQLCLILPCSTTWEIIGDSYQQKTFPWSKEPGNTLTYQQMASLYRLQEELKDSIVTLGDDNLYFEAFIQMIGC